MDMSLFTLKHSVGLIWVLIYVDDILVTGSNKKLIDKFIWGSNKTFKLKDLIPVSYFLGIEVLHDKHGLHMS